MTSSYQQSQRAITIKKNNNYSILIQNHIDRISLASTSDVDFQRGTNLTHSMRLYNMVYLFERLISPFLYEDYYDKKCNQVKIPKIEEVSTPAGYMKYCTAVYHWLGLLICHAYNNDLIRRELISMGDINKVMEDDLVIDDNKTQAEDIVIGNED